MMFKNAEELLSYAKTVDIKLAIQNQQLLIDAPDEILTPELTQCLARHKPSLIFLLNHYGISREKLETQAEEDWDDIKGNSEALFAFADALYKQRLRERGEVPPTYISSTVCAYCGLVPVPSSMRGDGYVQSCVWCWNRLKGLPIPNIKAEKLN